MKPSRSELPGVTVVVPVYNEADILERCIDAILAQRYASSLVEAIFVDNGSSDSSRAILRRRGDRITALHEPRRGAAAARNAGVRAASNELLAFTDADCVADPNWIAELVRCALAHDDADLVGGRITALEPETPVERFEATIHDQHAAIEVYHPPTVASGNFMIRRRKLLEIGLFDESFDRGEDSELCYRAVLHHGCGIVYAHEAVVRHSNRRTRGALIRMGLSHGSSSARVWQRYAAQLGLSRRKRCSSIRSYREPLQQVWRSMRQGRSHEPRAEEDRQMALCDGLFRFSKQLGFLAGTLRYR